MEDCTAIHNQQEDGHLSPSQLHNMQCQLKQLALQEFPTYFITNVQLTTLVLISRRLWEHLLHHNITVQQRDQHYKKAGGVGAP
jgi:hypothetical protein